MGCLLDRLSLSGKASKGTLTTGENERNSKQAAALESRDWNFELAGDWVVCVTGMENREK